MAVIVAGLAAIRLVAAYPDVIIPGDPAAYRTRVEAILSGGLPYFDVPFEHLPVMLIPMLAAWTIGGWVSQRMYIIAFAVLTTGILAGCVPLIGALGRRLDARGSVARWLIVTLPLVPLVIFRNDPVSLLLFLVAAVWFLDDRPGWVVAGGLGALAKVWPAVIGLGERKYPPRGRSLWVLFSGAIAVGLTLLPGFASARRAVGLHAETVVGALVGAGRVLGGHSSGVDVTTAAYLDAGRAALLLNSAVGLCSSSVSGFWSLARASDNRRTFLALGVITAGTVLVSPLFSLQYVLWLTPFLALSRHRTTLAVGAAVSVLTIYLTWIWHPSLFEQVWFFLLLTARNAMFLLLATRLALEAAHPADS